MALAANHRIHLIYITPNRFQALGLEKEDKILKSLFNKYDIKVVYLRDRLAPRPTKEWEKLFHDSVHLSKEGHSAWAETIAADIRKKIYENEPKNT